MFTNQTMGEFNLCISNIYRFVAFTGQILPMAFSSAALIFRAVLD